MNGLKKFCFILVLLLLQQQLVANQETPSLSPHGDIEYDCGACHTADSWTVDPGKITFRHDQTGFALIGVHGRINCRSCHQSLKFSFIGSSCMDCHLDVQEHP